MLLLIVIMVKNILKIVLRSIVNQTYKNWELIFWDNFSTDQSKKVLNEFNDKRIKSILKSKNFTFI